MEIKIIFQNEFVVVANKPSGSLSTPARDAQDPRPCLGIELQKHLGQQIFPVHRLDFEVSGLLLFAKTKASHKECQSWFENSVVKKTYEALTLPGQQDPQTFKESTLWRSKLAKGKRRAFEAPHGKESLTEASLIASDAAGFWRWSLSPLTGRSHQLRFEMTKHGFPILGDELYGGVKEFNGHLLSPQFIALRAVKLDFTAVAVAARFGLPAQILTESLMYNQVGFT